MERVHRAAPLNSVADPVSNNFLTLGSAMQPLIKGEYLAKDDRNKCRRASPHLDVPSKLKGWGREKGTYFCFMKKQAGSAI